MATPQEKKGIKALSTGRSDVYRIAPSDLHIKEGWNCREPDDPDNRAHIDSLAKSIAENGVRNPLTVYYEDGFAYVSDGHCRLAAVARALELYGVQVATVPVVVEERWASEADRVASQIIRNSGKNFAPIETARVYKRLIDLGWSEEDVATKTAISKTRVVELLNLYATPEPIKDMIRTGRVSSTLVTQVMRKTHGNARSAVDILERAVKEADADGRKATARFVIGMTPRAVAKKVREALDASHTVINRADGKAEIFMPIGLYEEMISFVTAG